jgi:hypothetical protein
MTFAAVASIGSYSHADIEKKMRHFNARVMQMLS